MIKVNNNEVITNRVIKKKRVDIVGDVNNGDKNTIPDLNNKKSPGMIWSPVGSGTYVDI